MDSRFFKMLLLIVFSLLLLTLFSCSSDTKTAAAGKTYTDPTTGMEFVRVEGGCFQMGDNFGDGDSNEKPVHEVCLDDYYIGKYEVTQGQWASVMGSNPSGFKKGDKYPVENVSWEDVQKFIDKLSRKTGRTYRLPTEAEWEYAARSGGKKEKYSGGSDDHRVAQYRYNFTHRVGTKSPNGLGIYDMSGNVWEWVQDWYGKDYYSSSSRSNPQGPSSGSSLQYRGGGWNSSSKGIRAANRGHGFKPVFRNNILGFRLALSPGQ